MERNYIPYNQRERLDVDKTKLMQLINEQAGKFFTVLFKKRDGSERCLNGRTGVQKHCNGGTNHAVQKKNSNITVWEANWGNPNIRSYRNIPLSRVKEVRLGKKIYNVI